MAPYIHFQIHALQRIQSYIKVLVGLEAMLLSNMRENVIALTDHRVYEGLELTVCRRGLGANSAPAKFLHYVQVQVYCHNIQ